MFHIPKAALQFGDFLAYLMQRFIADRCTRAAASLAYTTLLALVPLFTVVFVTLSAFPAFQSLRGEIEAFIFENFVPALGEQVRGYLVEFTDKARGLQAAGVIFLLVAVMAMMATIESAFNVIWRVKRKRPVIVRFLVYWAVLTLGPLLIGASVVVTSYLVSLPLLSESVATLDMRFDALRTVPFIATTLAFVLFFKLIPYRPVPLKHALIGAVTASTLFELAKRAFAYYVTNFPTQQAVYGAFATLPIFLLWIYLSWLIVLLGAEITQCLTIYNVVSTRRRADLFDNPIFAAYRALTHLYHAQHDGRALTDKELFRFERQLGYEALNSSLERLAAANWISRNDAFEWILSRDLNRTTLVDLMRVVPATVPTDNVAGLSLDRSDERFMAALMNHAQWLDAELAIPIAALIGENIEAAQPE